MMATKKLKCTCKHDGQDKLHGSGVRVHNFIENKQKPDWRCTVCEKERGDK